MADQHESNPYSSPITDPAVDPRGGPQIALDAATLKKVEAIIKDAGQYWLAILICLVCSALGSIIIGPWYLARLLQWQQIARQQPQLLTPGAPRGTLEQRFQTAKRHLMIGIGFGGLVLLVMIGALVVMAIS
jgi:hypothetical protein